MQCRILVVQVNKPVSRFRDVSIVGFGGTAISLSWWSLKVSLPEVAYLVGTAGVLVWFGKPQLCFSH